jgi:ABC-type bacteriocin/lantibiotic exporter with double-glycine peptidase domain
VGPNGAGKTTTLALLTRMLSPDGGTIYVDGADIARANLRSLRRAIAVVSQRDFIAYGAIRDNIDFGPDALTEDQVEAAARRAGLHAFIAGLPDGYATFVGSGGSTLSGGQRKLLMLARALACEPRILILDEPTAMLDQPARDQVLSVLGALRGETTLIVATHDPAVVAAADVSVQIARPSAPALSD